MSSLNQLNEEQRTIEQRWHRLLADNPTKDNIEKAYEELHSFYLRTKGYVYSTTMDITQRVILRLVGSGKNILEMGSGNGDLACWLGNQRNTVLGFDISSRAVESGQNKAAELKLEGRVKFQQGSAIKTGLPEMSFDIVVSQWLIEHIHPSQVGLHLDEVSRILKPDGAYIFTTPNRYDGASSFGMHLKEWGFTEMRRLVEQHGFTCYWLDTRVARIGRPILIPPCMLWIPGLMEKVYARLPCKRILRPILRPNVFFLARKVDK
jgi:2-polyprenyl-3-methyl-5-hydroxy-6-metoxy-1,4-benzoquinol methylase